VRRTSVRVGGSEVERGGIGGAHLTGKLQNKERSELVRSAGEVASHRSCWCQSTSHIRCRPVLSHRPRPPTHSLGSWWSVVHAPPALQPRVGCAGRPDPPSGFTGQPSHDAHASTDVEITVGMYVPSALWLVRGSSSKAKTR
jgi:hypothetical protein